MLDAKSLSLDTITKDSYKLSNYFILWFRFLCNRDHKQGNLFDIMENMETYLARYLSYKDFPGASLAYPTRLAEAGFYYVGPDDAVRCFSCSITKSNWEFFDNPLEIHKRLSPNCSFLSDSISGLDANDSDITIGFNFSVPESTSCYPDIQATHDGNEFLHRLDDTANGTNILKEDGACKFERFKTISNREQSFKHWQYGCIQDPQRLAASGFFFEGLGDSVRCYSCGGGLRKWEKEDDPWTEHARWYPCCAHVVLNRGSAFIHNVQARSSEYNSNKNRFSHALDKNDSDIMRSLLDMGFNRSEVTEAVRIWNERTDKPFSCNDLQEIILSTERSCRKLRASSHKEDSSHRAGAEAEKSQCLRKSLSYYTMSLLCHSLTKEKEQLEKTVCCKNLELKKCHEDLHQLKTQLSCKICLIEINSIRVVLLPCGHMFCVSCSAQIETCGICRMKIEGRVKTYLS